MPNSEKVLKTLIDYRKEGNHSHDVCYEFMLFALIRDFLKVDREAGDLGGQREVGDLRRVKAHQASGDGVSGKAIAGGDEEAELLS